MVSIPLRSGTVVCLFSLLTLERLEAEYGVGVFEIGRQLSEQALSVPADVQERDAERRKRIAEGGGAAAAEPSPLDQWLATPEGEAEYRKWISSRSIAAELKFVAACAGLDRRQIAEELEPTRLLAVGRQLRGEFFKTLNAMQSGEDDAKGPTSAA